MRERRGAGPRETGLPLALKRLGQHFLRDERILERIAEAVAPEPEQTIVEIGPGRGALTAHLVPRAGRVIAIEIDRKLVPLLRERFADAPHVEIIEGDVLALELGTVAGADFVLAGNVPYYITTPILFHALRPPRPRRAVYLVQKEVADRLSATAGSREYGALSINVQALASVDRLFTVAPGAFSPPPRVESAVVRIVPHERPLIPPPVEAPFRTFVQEAFGYRRKQMRRVLRSITGTDAAAAERLLDAAGIAPDARPETLTPADFARLLAQLSSFPAGQHER